MFASLKINHSNQSYFQLKTNFQKRKSPFLISLMSCVQKKPIPGDDPRATML